MARSSNFDVRNLKAAKGRNKHDLSYRNVFSTKFGMLVPFMVQDVVAGSSVQVSLEHQTRTMPMVRPAFSRLREHYDYFFVPYSQVWHAYDNFKTQQSNQRSTLFENQFPNVVNALPTFSAETLRQALNDRATDAAGYQANFGNMRIGDLLGYGCFVPEALPGVTDVYQGANEQIYYNAFRLAAYQKIYYDYYRNDKYEANLTSAYNLDDLANGANIPLDRLKKLMRIHYRWRKKDYFMQTTPDVLPTLNQFARNGFAASVTAGSFNSTTNILEGQMSIPNGGVVSSVTSANPLDNPNNNINTQNINVGVAETFPYNNVSSSQSVMQHRFAAARQKLLERMYAAKSDFSSQMLAIYGIAPIEGRNGSVSHIGGFSELLPIGDVENNTDSYTNSPYGGKVNTFGGTKNFKYKALEDGIIMGIYSTSMEADYCSDRVDRFNFKRVPEDYYIPEYETLGKQALFSVEYQNHYLYTASDNTEKITRMPVKVIGFVPRYDEYRSHVDEVHLSGGPGVYQDGVLQGYTAPLNQGLNVDKWVLSQQHMIYKPSNLDVIFGVQADGTVGTDQFLCNFYNDVKCISPLKVRSEL